MGTRVKFNIELTPREVKVLRIRYGLDHLSASEIVDTAMLRERILQIEAKALRKLRHPRLLGPDTSREKITTWLKKN